jgi:dTDP-4-amino-4,6-dideoxygalactose transaminase
MFDRLREVPPTAGLPLRWRDFLPADDSLETQLAAFLDVPSVEIECSGTAALIVALTALSQSSRRRRVIIPAYTCPLVALAVAHCGLELVICDVRRGGFDFCARSLRELCDDDTLAVVPTHLGGRVADVAATIDVARAAGASVIEDAAQSLGAVGISGDIGFYSLAAGKGLTIYEGGALVARDDALRQSLREASKRIAPRRLLWESRRLIELAGYAALYRPLPLRLAYGAPLRRALRKGKLVEAVGDDFSERIPLHRVGAWRRSVGARALKRLPAFLRAGAAQAARRIEALRAMSGLTVIGDDGGGTWPFFMVLLPTERARDAALARLWTAGLGVSRLFIHALPDYPYLAPLLRSADVPNARDLAARMLTISNSPWLRDGDFDRICSVLRTTATAAAAG